MRVLQIQRNTSHANNPSRCTVDDVTFKDVEKFD